MTVELMEVRAQIDLEPSHYVRVTNIAIQDAGR